MGANVPGHPHPGYENGTVADRSPGYIPGEPDEGFANGALVDSHATNSLVVGSSNADPVDAGPASGPAAPEPGTLEWLEATTVPDVHAYLDTLDDDDRDAVVELERSRGPHARKGITGDD